jgi:hypothetical protein
MLPLSMDALLIVFDIVANYDILLFFMAAPGPLPCGVLICGNGFDIGKIASIFSRQLAGSTFLVFR